MKKRVALVLGSGGARGYAHIGVIEEIERRGYDIACIAGCSMGAVVGGIYAAGKLKDYRDWIESLDYLDVLRLVDVSFRLGAIRGEKVFGQIRKIVGEINIEDLRIPYTAVATDLTNQQEIWFQEGCLHQAMRASAAIPSLFTPVMQGNRMLVEVHSVRLLRGDRVVGVFGQLDHDPVPVPLNAHPSLTPRQSEILRLLERGKSTDQIAVELHISKETVRNHIRHMLQSLGVHSRLEAVALARHDHLAGIGSKAAAPSLTLGFTGEPLVPPWAPSLRASAWFERFRSRRRQRTIQTVFASASLPPGKARLRRLMLPSLHSDCHRDASVGPAGQEAAPETEASNGRGQGGGSWGNQGFSCAS